MLVKGDTGIIVNHEHTPEIHENNNIGLTVAALTIDFKLTHWPQDELKYNFQSHYIELQPRHELWNYFQVDVMNLIKR